MNHAALTYVKQRLSLVVLSQTRSCVRLQLTIVSVVYIKYSELDSNIGNFMRSHQGASRTMLLLLALCMLL